MPKGQRGFVKGVATNPKGRIKGSSNRTTKQAKEFLEQIMFGQLDNLNTALEALKKDPGKYIDAYSKLFGYVLPKKTDVTSGDEKIQIQLPTVLIQRKKNGD